MLLVSVKGEYADSCFVRIDGYQSALLQFLLELLECGKQKMAYRLWKGILASNLETLGA